MGQLTMAQDRRLPIRLGKEPIVDAVCEIQLASSVRFSQVMPGFLYSKLKGDKKVNQQPASMLPSDLTRIDPKLRFAPLSAMEWNGYTISFSDSSILIKCKLPYPRWATYREAIKEIVDSMLEIDIITEISRFSLKYVDLVEGNTPEDRVSNTAVALSIGDITLENQNYQTQIEVREPDSKIIHIIQLASPAHMQSGEGKTIKLGTLITTDSIQLGPIPSIETFKTSFIDSFDKLHQKNKEVFFKCLSDSGLESLEPIYE